MNYIDNFVKYEITDVIEAAINDMNLTGTEYEGQSFIFIHGLPIDVINEHTNYHKNKLPVVILFEPIDFPPNLDDDLTTYKSGSLTLYFMDKNDRFKKAKQTERNYENVITPMNAIVNEFYKQLLNQRQVTEEGTNITGEQNWSDWAANVEQTGPTNSSKYMLNNMTGKEITLSIETHKIYNC